jgi:hypothetical protein
VQGLTAAVVDSATGAFAHAVNSGGNVTGHLSINYRRPIPADSWIAVVARVRPGPQGVLPQRRKIWIDYAVTDGTGTDLSAAAAAATADETAPAGSTPDAVVPSHSAGGGGGSKGRGAPAGVYADGSALFIMLDTRTSAKLKQIDRDSQQPRSA